MYSGGFYPYSSLEEFWAWWSRAIWVNRYAVSAGQPYLDLLKLIKGRDYFVLTTNVDHQFQLAGFDKNRLFYTQGDYGLWQCSVPCHDKTYDNKEVVKKMVEEQKDQKIPSSLIPHCPKCGEPMTMNLRYDDTFVQDEGWYAAARRYDDFLKNHKDQKVVFLELGVGGNTPSIIKYPFWQMTSENPNAKYVCINAAPSRVPEEIKQRSLCLQADLGKVLHELAESSNG